MSGIFGAIAESYYEAGMPVIPLGKRSKRPVPTQWQEYHDKPVEPYQQQLWMRDNFEGNVGLVLGKQSGLVMFDIDAMDQSIIDLLTDLMPKSPWVRIGAKGMVMAYRWSGIKTFRIKTAAGESVCELLSDRTQCVLPPSIHPDTGKPYIANCDLLDVLKDVPELDRDIETRLRTALKDAGVDLSHTGWTKVTEYVSRGSRDVSLTEKAGLFAYAVLRGERSLKEAIGMLQTFGREFVEAVAGDEIEMEKHVDNLLKFVRRDVLDKNKQLPEGWDKDLSEEEKIAWGVNFDAEHEEWEFSRLVQYLQDGMENFDVGDNNRIKVIEKVLTRVASSKNLSTLDEARLVSYIVDTNRMGLKAPEVKRRLRELRSGDILGADHAEIAKAVLADLESLYEVRKHDTRLWKYNGSNWEPLDEGDLLGLIARDYGHLEASRRHGDHKGILSTMINLAKSGIRTRDVPGVNFANGFLNDELELVEHRHEHGMTYTLPFRYLPELAGKQPQFMDLLRTAWGHDSDYQEKVDALQEALCVTLFGVASSFQRAFLLRGVAKSGKTQVLQIAKSLVPENARSFVPPTEWGDKFMPALMHEKLINVAGELSESRMIDGMSFKDIVDGTERSAQFKNAQIFRLRCTCAHWFASNYMPKTRDSSEGFTRRWLIFEFNRPVPVSERRLDVGDVIVAEEREAIVAWAVQARERLMKNREFTLPLSHLQSIKEMGQTNNNVRFFLEENATVEVTAQDSDKISETALYREYWGFCLGPGGSRPVTSRLFRAMMREMQHEKGIQLHIENTPIGAQEAVYLGMRLRPRV